jgi:hypothetical protein
VRLAVREAGGPSPDAVTATLTRPAGSLTGTTALNTPERSPYAREVTTFHVQRLCTHFSDETETVARDAPVATARTASER